MRFVDVFDYQYKKTNSYLDIIVANLYTLSRKIPNQGKKQKGV